MRQVHPNEFLLQVSDLPPQGYVVLEKSPQSIPPKLEEVKKYFSSQNTEEIEGERFFNHFQSNGWLVGGKSKMYNWQAAANNWILNLQSFKPVQIAFSNPVPGNLKTSNQKQYDEPL